MAMYLTNGLAIALSLLASVIFYLGCPNQQWVARRLFGFYPALVISLAITGLAWWLLTLNASALAAMFTEIALMMLILGLLPFFGQYAKPPASAKKEQAGINKDKNSANTQPRWWLTIITGVLLGFPLALGLAGLFAWWGPGPLMDDNKVQLVMWMVTPLWLTLLSLMFLCVKAKRFVAYCCGFNLLVYMLLWTAKSGF